ncbi:MAG: hypothetical protein IIA54_08325 [Chloroflexi bacterium]|nr:hypothetical protein [Chloroflexota bacterium]
MDLAWDNLALSVPVFLGSAVVVVIAGVALARFGDQIADITGWGALWVGTILVSVATSLPELITNISAIVIEDAPDLALGNVFGADMINMFTIAVVGMVFGARNLFSGQGRATQTLVLVAVGIAIVAIAVGATGDAALGPTSVGGLLIAAAYIGGMKLVYDAGKAGAGADDPPAPSASALRAWVGFGLAGLAILLAAPLLASSSVGIGDATGLGSSFMGVLAVSVVTTLPEASVTFAAARRKSYGLVIGNIYGSCAFNLFVIPIADLFHTEGPLLGEMGSAHFVAAGAAIVLMSMGFLVIRSYQDRLISGLRRLVYVVPPTYVGALAWVFRESRS